jgi:hypothetical protein
MCGVGRPAHSHPLLGTGLPTSPPARPQVSLFALVTQVSLSSGCTEKRSACCVRGKRRALRFTEGRVRLLAQYRIAGDLRSNLCGVGRPAHSHPLLGTGLPTSPPARPQVSLFALVTQVSLLSGCTEKRSACCVRGKRRALTFTEGGGEALRAVPNRGRPSVESVRGPETLARPESGAGRPAHSLPRPGRTLKERATAKSMGYTHTS